MKYNVTGMTCAACVSHVEKAVKGVDGVTDVAVNLLTNSMNVEGSAKADDIVCAVKSAGYGASPCGSSDKVKPGGEELKDTETPRLLKRLIASLIFLPALMYISMGHTMWGFPLPQALSSNPLAIGLTELIIASVIMLINNRFYVSGFKSLLKGSPNMDTLVAIGSSAAYIYSIISLFLMSGAYVRGDIDGACEYIHNLWFESAAMIVTLITVGKTLESYSKGKTTNALKGLMDLAPKQAVLEVDGEEKTVPVDEVKAGDIFIVKPGSSIPADGIVISGEGSVDESALTGESIPADKSEGSTVSAATINTTGYLRCRATKVGEDTALSGIIRMVSDASATKAPVARIADKVSGVFVPSVMAIAVITAVIWLIAGRDAGFALARGISVLVISCPCALGLATPVAIMVGNGVGAKNGILFKNAVSLESAGKTDIVVLDKTGTVTRGTPAVTDVFASDGVSENELLSLAYSLEKQSEHPLAKAVCTYCSEKNINASETESFTALPGNGIEASAGGRRLLAGSGAFIRRSIAVDSSLEKDEKEASENGKTPLFFADDGRILGLICVADEVKDDSPKAIEELKNMGIMVVMLTGDNERTAKAIGGKISVDEVIAGVLPDGKEKVIRSLKKEGRVAMVGDGINDAPALTSADTGIAIGAGTDVAIDAADVVLMKSSLSDVPAAIRLSRRTLTNIHENLFWAFIYNIIGIPLAAGAYIHLFGWTLSPMFGAAAMSLSSFCVVSNALRLNLVKIYDPKHDRKKKHKKTTDDKGEKAMTMTVKIDGMMCPHCEAHMNDAFKALPQVDDAVSSHTDKKCVLTLNAPLDAAAAEATVKSAGYTFLGIE